MINITSLANFLSINPKDILKIEEYQMDQLKDLIPILKR